MDFEIEDVCLWVFEGIVPPAVSRRPGDFLAFIVKRASGKLEAEYRFRWHAGASFDAKDEKHFYGIGPLDDTPEVRKNLLGAFRGILGQLDQPWEAEVNGDAFKLHEVMRAGPLMTKTVAPLGGKDPLGGRA